MYRKDRKEEFYTKKAKIDGYPARSVYKLIELDEKFKLFQENDKILDLGCVPGSWMIYLSKKVGLNGKIIGIDLSDIYIQLESNMEFIKEDIFKIKEEKLEKWQNHFNAVISDAAPSTTGIKDIDAARSLEIIEEAWLIASQSLKRKGIFLCKIFEGQGTDNFVKKIKKHFKLVKLFRPKAVSKYSREIYLVAKDYVI